MLFYSSVDPAALTIGPIILRWYGILFSGGFVAGYFMMHWFFRRKNYRTEDLDRLLIYLFVGTIVGARLGHCLIYDPDYYLANPIEILKIWRGGLASHGGTLGVLAAIYLFTLKKRYHFLELCDMLAVPVAMVACFIRLGNFMNSEILGIPTGGNFGVVFTTLGETFPRYPAQLFEAAAYLITFIILLTVYLKGEHKIPRGMILSLLFLLIFTSRFFIEPFKEEQADYSTGTIFTVGQILSIPFIIAALLLMIYVFWRSRRN